MRGGGGGVVRYSGAGVYTKNYRGLGGLVWRGLLVGRGQLASGVVASFLAWDGFGILHNRVLGLPYHRKCSGFGGFWG